MQQKSWILSVLAIFAGIYLFSQGFLLTRVALPQTSTSVALDARYRRVVLVMIDALRYDFLCPTLKTHPGLFENKLPVVKHLLATQPTHSLLLKGLADPPTTTLQRLVAIMTGGLPTLVDASTNFNGARVSQDNLISQIVHAGGNIITIGDDTWQKLFDDQLDPRSVFYPSFDVWDLDTVDRGVEEHLFPLLSAKNDAKLTIAHFLGVDHAGHRYGFSR